MYPIELDGVIKKIEKLIKDFKKMENYPRKRTTAAFKKIAESFLKDRLLYGIFVKTLLKEEN